MNPRQAFGLWTRHNRGTAWMMVFILIVYSVVMLADFFSSERKNPGLEKPFSVRLTAKDFQEREAAFLKNIEARPDLMRLVTLSVFFVLSAGLAICDKRRSGPTETEVMHVIGEVEGRNVILVDDMISTGTSIAEAARACRNNGAKDIYICATHAVLSDKAVEKLDKASLKEVVVTDTIPLDGKNLSNLRVLSIANLLGEAIRRIHHSESVSSLFV